jgi:hypothetical protein
MSKLTSRTAGTDPRRDLNVTFRPLTERTGCSTMGTTGA